MGFGDRTGTISSPTSSGGGGALSPQLFIPPKESQDMILWSNSISVLNETLDGFKDANEKYQDSQEDNLDQWDEFFDRQEEMVKTQEEWRKEDKTTRSEEKELRKQEIEARKLFSKGLELYHTALTRPFALVDKAIVGVGALIDKGLAGLRKKSKGGSSSKELDIMETAGGGSEGGFLGMSPALAGSSGGSKSDKLMTAMASKVISLIDLPEKTALGRALMGGGGGKAISAGGMSKEGIILALIGKAIDGLVKVLMFGIMAALIGFLAVVMLFMPIIADILRQISPVIVEAMQKIIPAIAEAISAMVGIFTALAPAITMFFNALLTLLTGVLVLVLEILKTLIPPILQVLLIVLDLVTQLLTLLVPAIITLLKILFLLIITLVKGLAFVITNIFERLLMPLLMSLIEIVDILLDIIVGVLMGVLTMIRDLMKAVWPLLQRFISLVVDVFLGMLEKVITVMEKLWGVISPLVDMYVELVTAVLGIPMAIINFAKSIFETIGSFADKIKNFFLFMVDAVVATMEALGKFILSPTKGKEIFQQLGVTLEEKRSARLDVTTSGNRTTVEGDSSNFVQTNNSSTQNIYYNELPPFGESPFLVGVF